MGQQENQTFQTCHQIDYSHFLLFCLSIHETRMQHPVHVFPGAAAQRATLETACEEETPCSASPLIDSPRLLLLRSGTV